MILRRFYPNVRLGGTGKVSLRCHGRSSAVSSLTKHLALRLLFFEVAAACLFLNRSVFEMAGGQ